MSLWTHLIKVLVEELRSEHVLLRGLLLYRNSASPTPLHKYDSAADERRAVTLTSTRFVLSASVVPNSCKRWLHPSLKVWLRVCVSETCEIMRVTSSCWGMCDNRAAATVEMQINSLGAMLVARLAGRLSTPRFVLLRLPWLRLSSQLESCRITQLPAAVPPAGHGLGLWVRNGHCGFTNWHIRTVSHRIHCHLDKLLLGFSKRVLQLVLRWAMLRC